MPETLRPGDLLRPPLDSDAEPKDKDTKQDEKEIPVSWRKAIKDAGEWPFVDPDVMHKEEVDSFGDFPSEPENIPEAPAEMVPFSEFEPWGRMEEETDRDYELFSHYLASGLGRTYGKTARHFQISQPYISQRARKHDWPDRVKAWDDYRERVYTSLVIEKTKKMAEEHAGIAAKGIAALSIVFDEILHRADDPELMKLELSEMSTRALFTLADKAARALPNLMGAERLSRGLPTELTAEVQVKENRVTIQTTEELSEIINGLQQVLDTGADEDYVDVEGEEMEGEEE